MRVVGELLPRLGKVRLRVECAKENVQLCVSTNDSTLVVTAEDDAAKGGDFSFEVPLPAPIISSSQSLARLDKYSTLLTYNVESISVAEQMQQCDQYRQDEKDSLATQQVQCRRCRCTLLPKPSPGGKQQRRVDSLPSSHWHELSDLWMCHDDGVSGVFSKYPDGIIRPLSGTILVGKSDLLMSIADVNGGAIKVEKVVREGGEEGEGISGTNESDEEGEILVLKCARCKARLGKKEEYGRGEAGGEPEGYLLAKRSLLLPFNSTSNGSEKEEGKSGNVYESFSVESAVARMMYDAAQQQLCHDFEVYDMEKRKVVAEVVVQSWGSRVFDTKRVGRDKEWATIVRITFQLHEEGSVKEEEEVQTQSNSNTKLEEDLAALSLSRKEGEGEELPNGRNPYAQRRRQRVSLLSSDCASIILALTESNDSEQVKRGATGMLNGYLRFSMGEEEGIERFAI
uniref:HECT-type E3 ubiquitin transferase E3D n=1 Tax=Palpitomonas bilix TaxID=652834 RepID=A0A7S3DGQ2_9EUKA|mmetsp:Transcript_36176/g.94092  ORF Transcript_36176/g.94092 Transcript_36176/m.94092 type:complete len:456 (+) Transcript_36176:203-1570(+)